MNSPIEVAVAPLKNDAIEAAVRWATNEIEQVRAEMEKAGWDREIAAPYPKSFGMSRPAYVKAKSRHDRFVLLTKGRVGSRRPSEPDFADMWPERCDLFIDEAKKSAAAQYDAFVAKLVFKIGDVTAAVLDGNHVWSHSILTVTKADGSVEHWKTRQITNVSKLGKYFPQYPTRKVKG